MSSKIEETIENIDKMNNCPVPQCPSLPCGVLLTCQDCWRRALEEVRADAIRKFADKIKLHMIKYCHGRLDQQYCAIEIIDYIGKLMGEKDYSMDVEAEMKKHDEKVRQEAFKEVLDTMHEIYVAGFYCIRRKKSVKLYTKQSRRLKLMCLIIPILWISHKLQSTHRLQLTAWSQNATNLCQQRLVSRNEN